MSPSCVGLKNVLRLQSTQQPFWSWNFENNNNCCSSSQNLVKFSKTGVIWWRQFAEILATPLLVSLTDTHCNGNQEDAIKHRRKSHRETISGHRNRSGKKKKKTARFKIKIRQIFDRPLVVLRSSSLLVTLTTCKKPPSSSLRRDQSSFARHLWRTSRPDSHNYEFISPTIDKSPLEYSSGAVKTRHQSPGVVGVEYASRARARKFHFRPCTIVRYLYWPGPKTGINGVQTVSSVQVDRAEWPEMGSRQIC